MPKLINTTLKYSHWKTSSGNIIASVLVLRTMFHVITVGTRKGQETQAIHTLSAVGDDATCFELNHFLVNQSVTYPDPS